MITLDTHRQLFVDDALVEETHGVTRTLHPATKHPKNPVLRPEKPWEQLTAYLYGSVIRERGGLFRMWYQVWENEGAREGGKAGYRVCLATSRDGVRWKRPAFGFYPDGKNRATNIVGWMHNPSVIRDDRDPDSTRRYKMFSFGEGGYHVHHSPDGERWRPWPENPVLVGGDVSPCVFDPRSGDFLAFAKTNPMVLGRRRRSVGLSRSRDFTTWTPTKTILTVDDQDDRGAQELGYAWREIYGMSGFPYEGMYLGFVWLFNVWDRVPGGTHDGTFDVELTYSRDGATWHRFPTREPILPRSPCPSLKPSIPLNGRPPGPDDGQPRPFDAGMIVTASQPVVVGNEVWLYYGGLECTHGCKWYGEPENSHSRHGGAIGLAKWRRDGFVSMDAGPHGGTLTTRPFRFSDLLLTLNAETPGGEIRVEVLDEDSRPIPGFSARDCDPIKGERVRQEVRWHDVATSIGRLAGRPIRLRFQMRNAKLYSFEFEAHQHASWGS